jgi:hypothetical protein
MPQPSHFAIGLPVSRFAAMAKPVGVVEKKEGTQPPGQARSKARRPTLVSRFAAMPMPVIMVEEKAPRPPKASERLTARLKSVTPQVKAGTKAQRIRVAAAR